jgi:hypothetical protein
MPVGSGVIISLPAAAMSAWIIKIVFIIADVVLTKFNS